MTQLQVNYVIESLIEKPKETSCLSTLSYGSSAPDADELVVALFELVLACSGSEVIHSIDTDPLLQHLSTGRDVQLGAFREESASEERDVVEYTSTPLPELSTRSQGSGSRY